jgi:hypothetical protein
MNEPDDLLKFLVLGLYGRQKDLVTKGFYKFAEGDPNSSPVNEAVLLTAFSRRLALAPQEFREANAEFSKLLEKGREMEARIRERVELSNAGVVASFKDEATRAASSIRTSSQNNEKIVLEGMKMAEVMRDSRSLNELLLSELRRIKAELKVNHESNEKTAEATANTKASILTIKEIMHRVTLVFALSWMSIGVGIGFVLAVIAMQVSGWVALLILGLAIGLLQALARSSWNFVKELAKELKDQS